MLITDTQWNMLKLKTPLILKANSNTPCDVEQPLLKTLSNIILLLNTQGIINPTMDMFYLEQSFILWKLK